MTRQASTPAGAWRTIGAALVAAVALVLPSSADPDLWGHLRFGLDLLQRGRLSAIDPYSFTQDRPWINHEWLSEAQMALAYTAGGTGGLLLLKAALIAAALWVIWTSLDGVDFTPRLLAAATALLGGGRAFGTLRPQLWSILCFVILCRALTGDARGRWWLPALFAVWANLHGGWLVGMGVLGLWAAGRVWSRPTDARHWTLMVSACAAATLVTPYGWRLWRFLWETVGLGRDVTEWQPLWTVPPPAWIPWGAAAVAIGWVALRRELGWSRVLVLGTLAYVSLAVERVAPFFVAGSALLLADSIRTRWPQRAIPVPAAGAFQLGASVAGLAVVALSWRVATSACLPVRGAWIPDIAAAAQLTGGSTGRLVTSFDWGQYAIWHWGDRLRVSTDGRRETIYSDRRLEEHDMVVAGTPEGLAVLAAWRPEYVWLPVQHTSTRAWLEAHGYRIDAETVRSFVAVRDDLARLSPATGVAFSWCFP